MNNITIPANSNATYEDFFSIGISIIDKFTDDFSNELYQIKLPDGWIHHHIRSDYYEIRDELNNLRISYQCNPTAANTKPKSFLHTRYSLIIRDASKSDPRDMDVNKISFIDNTNHEIIFSMSNKNLDILKREMEIWTSINYPDWKKFTAYWESNNKKKHGK